MLNATQLDALPIPTTDLYERYTVSVIEDIARRLSKLDMTGSSAHQLQMLLESGAVFENALEEIAMLTGKTVPELKRTFEKAGVTSMRFDDSIYKAAGLDPLPLNQSPAMAAVMKAGFEKTNGIMRNLTLTTAIDAMDLFVNAADLAYLQVTTGAMDYKTAITKAVRDVGDSGLYVHYPSGHRDRLDVAMRRSVLTGITQTTSQLQLTRAQEMGQSLVQVSQHFGSRPSHATFQGKIFALNGFAG